MKKIFLLILLTTVFSQNDTYVNIEVKNKTKAKRKTKREIEEEEMNKLWDEKIHSFYPLHLMTFDIDPAKSQQFYFDLEVVPNKFIVAYYVHDEESKINFEINDNVGNNLYRNFNKNKLYHELEVTKALPYVFHLRNPSSDKKNRVTFGFSLEKNNDLSLSADHLDPLYNQIDSIDNMVKDIRFTQRMLSDKMRGHFKIVKVHNKNIVRYNIIETVVMSLIVLIQMFYLKKLVNNAN
jgi:hypothetical protein